MIEANAPFAKEKAMTPIIITNEQKIISKVFVPEMSPYPTVVIVVIVQYKEMI
jgi:hypothetical protein